MPDERGKMTPEEALASGLIEEQQIIDYSDIEAEVKRLANRALEIEQPPQNTGFIGDPEGHHKRADDLEERVATLEWAVTVLVCLLDQTIGTNARNEILERISGE